MALNCSWDMVALLLFWLLLLLLLLRLLLLLLLFLLLLLLLPSLVLAELLAFLLAWPRPRVGPGLGSTPAIKSNSKTKSLPPGCVCCTLYERCCKVPSFDGTTSLTSIGSGAVVPTSTSSHDRMMWHLLW